jgi:hypothetical protein
MGLAASAEPETKAKADLSDLWRKIRHKDEAAQPDSGRARKPIPGSWRRRSARVRRPRDNAINVERGWLAGSVYRSFFKGVRTYRSLGRSGSQRVAFWMLIDVATGGAAGVARRASAIR